ncbi:hypothetical protein [Chryseobacterium aquaticum]|uniref:Uncharacterized protein n=1 Tax=Chryseobacterium aquaticum subsp. greenlandense TaxID=345663 RepID=A0A101CJE6_9FLAO|nr:hypothetical protein [Chryseobacterium aquaticum]KUJ57070.1 hypothetical protein AR686_05230 [Chryseobacterium aquaticum subsp. greenlandense]
MKKISILMLMASIFFLCSCRNEADALQETTSNSLQIQKFGSSQLISINTVKKEIKNFSKIQNKFISSTAAKTSTIIDSDNVLYRKWENTTTGTKTYTLPINTYSAQMPYYMIQQILVSSNGAETTRYLKIIPTTPPAYKTQDVLKNLTGSIEVYNENLSFVFATDYINGVATKNNEQMANKSAGECTTSFTITEVTCSNGGGHGVGASCDTGLTNDAHYVVNIDISCPHEFGPATIGNPESSGSGNLGGGYVFDEQLNALLTNPTFLYGDYLTSPGHELLLQIVRQWIPANVTDINGDLSELNTRLQHFSNNDQMFNNLATYNQNTPNVPNAEVTDYSIRVYELFKFLLNNPSPENGQIAAWAVSFFDQNRFISWEEFKNSYIMNAGFISYINTLPMSLKQVIYNQANQEFLFGLNTYYTSQAGSQQAKNFINWALQFKAGNTTTTWTTFKPMLTFLHNFLQDNPNISSHFSQYPEDLNKILFKGLNYNNISDVTFANKFALAFTEILVAEKNNTVSQVNVQDPTWSLAKEYMIYLIKQNAASAVKYGRVIYEHASQYFSQHPNSLQKVNSFLEYLKVGVELEIPIEKNHQYMKWTDVLLCWLFELGDFPVNDSAGYGNLPTIGFSGSDYTISGIPSPNIIPMRYLSAHKMKNGIPDVNSVLDVKKTAIERIKLGNYTPFNREWVFGSDATVDTITKLDGMQFCLGSYRTDVYITALGNNQYKLTYIIKNKTGWQSGTRGLNDYNGNPTDDSIIPDKLRGTGVQLGGTIGETFGWYEIITVP